MIEPVTRSLRRATRAALVGLVAVASLAIAGCSGDATTTAPSGSDAAANGGTASTTATTATTVDPAEVDTVREPVAVPYWIRGTVIGNGQARPLPPDVDRVRFALDQLLAGPSEAEQNAGLRTLIRTDTYVQSFEVVDGTAHVGLNRAFQTAETRPQVAQVVYTLTQFPEVQRVQFTIDGTPNGATGVKPITRADLEDITPEVLVELPTVDQSVQGRLRLEGTAITPDGLVPWRLEDATGAAVASGSDDVRGGAGTRGTFVTAIDLPAGAAGPYTVVVVSRDATTGVEKDQIRIPVIAQPA